ncbi:hypothetical protein MMC29_003101, partial [Sticta canariensis]|nr:hypothetical protein [Sticta canariensis]
DGDEDDEDDENDKDDESKALQGISVDDHKVVIQLLKELCIDSEKLSRVVRETPVS